MEVIKQRKGSAGGIAQGIKAKEEAIRKYYLSPNICKECLKVIELNNKKVSEIRVKVFCNKSCAAIFNNKKREQNVLYTETRRIKFETLKNEKSIYRYNECKCGELKLKTAKLCSNCKGINSVENKTYKEFKDRYSDWWNSRVPIAKDARRVYNKSDKPKECAVCGYNNHIQVCHIKAVKDFDENTLIKEINSLDNLIALCPNHHWEYDHGLITI